MYPQQPWGPQPPWPQQPPPPKPKSYVGAAVAMVAVGVLCGLCIIASALQRRDAPAREQEEEQEEREELDLDATAQTRTRIDSWCWPGGRRGLRTCPAWVTDIVDVEVKRRRNGSRTAHVRSFLTGRNERARVVCVHVGLAMPRDPDGTTGNVVVFDADGRRPLAHVGIGGQCTTGIW